MPAPTTTSTPGYQPRSWSRESTSCFVFQPGSRALLTTGFWATPPSQTRGGKKGLATGSWPLMSCPPVVAEGKLAMRGRDPSVSGLALVLLVFVFLAFVVVAVFAKAGLILREALVLNPLVESGDVAVVAVEAGVKAHH